MKNDSNSCWDIKNIVSCLKSFENNHSYLWNVQRMSILTRQKSKFEAIKKMQVTSDTSVPVIKRMQDLY